MHPRFAERIAANLARVKRTKGKDAASRWWKERFDKLSKSDTDEVILALKRRNGQAV